MTDLRDTHGQTWQWPYISSPDPLEPQDLRRAWLFFLPGAFTPVCTGELEWVPGLARELMDAHRVGLRVIATDSLAVLQQLQHDSDLHDVPLLSDFWPHGAATASFDALNTDTGHPLRHSVLVESGPDAQDVRVLARITASADEPRTPAQHLNSLP